MRAIEARKGQMYTRITHVEGKEDSMGDGKNSCGLVCVEMRASVHGSVGTRPMTMTKPALAGLTRPRRLPWVRSRICKYGGVRHWRHIACTRGARERGRRRAGVGDYL